MISICIPDFIDLKNIKVVVLTALLFCFSLNVEAQTDTSSMDTVLISAGKFTYRSNSIVAGRDLIESSILPVSGNNITQLLTYMPLVSRSQELSSGINIKGSGLYASKYYFNDLPLKPVTHNYGFFSGINAQTLESVEIYDGYVPASYNSGGGIAKFQLKSPLSEKNGLSVLINPFNVSLFGNLKITPRQGIMASYMNSYSGALAQEMFGTLLNTYQDIFVSTDHLLAKNKWKLKTYYFDFHETQNEKSGFGVLGSYESKMRNTNLGFHIENNGPEEGWYHRLSGMYTSDDLKVTPGFADFRKLEKNLFLQYRLKNRTKKRIPELLIETNAVRVNVGEPGNTRTIENVLGSVAALHEFKAGRFKANMDLRLNHFWIGSASRLMAMYRLNGEYTFSGRSKMVLSANRFIHANIGASNNLIPLLQDLYVPVYEVDKIPVSYDLNAKYLFTYKKIELQYSVNYCFNRNASDFKSINTEIYDLDNLEYGLNRYLATVIGFSYKLKRTIVNANLTYSSSMNYFDSINSGVKYRSGFDRPLLFNLLLNTSIKRMPLSVQFTAQSGRPITLPVGFLFAGVLDWSYRNEFRTRPFHHLDIGLGIMNRRISKHLHHNLNIHLYNVYMRRNVYNIIYKDNEFRELSVFPFLFSIEYKISIN